MSVNLIPNSDKCFELGVSNGSWFVLCAGPLEKFLGMQTTNDPMRVDAITADRCADALDLWEPPKGWFSEGKERKGKQLFQEFFRTCNGFVTQ